MRYPSPLGCIELVSHDECLVGAWFADSRPAWTQKWNVDYRIEDAGYAVPPVLQQAAAELAAYFAGSRKRFGTPLARCGGSDFSYAVWQNTLTIPFGATSTYGTLAQCIAEQGIACTPRTVATALHTNPLQLFQPCHRVVYASGGLSGYAAGPWRKQALLRLESSPAY